MDRTFKEGIVFNWAKRALDYKCGCGKTIEIRIEDLIPDQFIDYHGCGNGDVSFTLDQVAEYRKNAGLPQLG